MPPPETEWEVRSMSADPTKIVKLDGEPREQLAQAIGMEGIPRIYFNGFAMGIGTGDTIIVLKNGEKPVAILNASYTVAKTLVQKLGAGISTLEEVSGNSIMTTDEVQAALQKGSNENPPE